MKSKKATIIGSTDGIGLALTQALLGDGWSVLGMSRSPATVSHASYQHVTVDVRSDQDYRDALRTHALDSECVVYLAGTGDALDVTSPDTWAAEHAVFEVNLMGLVATAQEVLPGFVARKAGHLIGISSQADRLINPGAPSYSASKAAMSNYLEGLALAVRPHGVAVTNVRPGFVDTKMAKGPIRPFMVSPERAARRILKALRRRPVRLTFPWRMAALMTLVRLPTRLRAWWH